MLKKDEVEAWMLLGAGLFVLLVLDKTYSGAKKLGEAVSETFSDVIDAVNPANEKNIVNRALNSSETGKKIGNSIGEAIATVINPDAVKQNRKTTKMLEAQNVMIGQGYNKYEAFGKSGYGFWDEKAEE